MDLRAQILAAVAAADPGLSAVRADAALDAVLTHPAVTRELATELAADPAALFVGAPPVIGRLVAALRSTGSVLPEPACARCGRTDRPLTRSNAAGVCPSCRRRQLATARARCGVVKPIAGRDGDGEASPSTSANVTGHSAVGSRGEGYRIHVNPAGSRSLWACLPDRLWEPFVATSGRGRLGFLTEQFDALVVVEETIMYPDGAGDPAEDHYAVDRRTLLLTGALVPARLQTGMNTVMVDAPLFLSPRPTIPRPGVRRMIEHIANTSVEGTDAPYLLCALVTDPAGLPNELASLDSDALVDPSKPSHHVLTQAPAAALATSSPSDRKLPRGACSPGRRTQCLIC